MVTTVLDGRWLGKGGVGTFTRSLVSGLGEVRPEGRWLLWGPPPFARAVWPGAVHVPTDVDPAAWFGQRSAFRVPPGDLALHLHQTRPLHRGPTAVCVHDLIQMRDPSPALRLAKTLRLRVSVREADAVLTVSPSVRDELVAVLGVDPAAVTVVQQPADAAMAARIAARRAVTPPARVIVAVGRFSHHKNHRRLVEAFAGTRFAASGGRLQLIGGTPDQLRCDRPLPPGVDVLGVVDGPRLEQAMADALVLVQPSLVEGYGLPVAEALLAGVPVTSSAVPVVTDFGPCDVPVFDPTSIADMRDQVDETVDLVESGRYWQRVDRASWVARQPTPVTLANQVLDGLRRAQLL